MLVFLNPHVDDFLAAPPQGLLTGRKPLLKYGFLFKKMHQESKKIYVLMDETLSCFIPYAIFRLLPLFLKKCVCRTERIVWMYLNREIAPSICFVRQNEITNIFISNTSNSFFAAINHERKGPEIAFKYAATDNNNAI